MCRPRCNYNHIIPPESEHGHGIHEVSVARDQNDGGGSWGVDGIRQHIDYNSAVMFRKAGCGGINFAACVPIIILSATSFLPLCGQSVRETPHDWSSERKPSDLSEFCSESSRYALKSLTVPYWWAICRMLSITILPAL